MSNIAHVCVSKHEAGLDSPVITYEPSQPMSTVSTACRRSPADPRLGPSWRPPWQGQGFSVRFV